MTPSIVIDNTAATERWIGECCFITEWLNRPDEPGLSVARARVPARSTTRWHRLVATVERYVVLDGEGRVELGDGTRALLRPGDVVVIPAGCAQRIHNPGAGELVFLAICTPRFLPDHYQDLEADHGRELP